MTLCFPSSSAPIHHSTNYFSENYTDARNSFRTAAAAHDILCETLPIQARGPNDEELSVDIAWIGPRDATNIMIHISGTHGVEGFAGSAIQHSLLQDPIQLPENTSLILIHGLNPYGMAHFRRVSENNVDLNRNCTDERTTPETYQKIDELMNPKKFRKIDLFTFRFGWAVATNSWSEIKETLARGQYDFEEGLFYGGRALEESPRKVFEWFERNFRGIPEDVEIAIIDVHTGLGPYAQDTLLTEDNTPTEHMESIFGEKIHAESQKEITGYQPKGLFGVGLREQIHRITGIANEKISLIGQEFGTVSVWEVINALRDENTQHFEARRRNEALSPENEGRQRLLRAFYPIEPEWRNAVLQKGRELVVQELRLFNPHLYSIFAEE